MSHNIEQGQKYIDTTINAGIRVIHVGLSMVRLREGGTDYSMPISWMVDYIKKGRYTIYTEAA